MSSLLVKWMKETFKHGFSHSSIGNKMMGKKIIVSFITGDPGENTSNEWFEPVTDSEYNKL